MRQMNTSELRGALRDVAVRLERAGVQGRLYVTGGAAMALAYDADRLTRDIDAAITHGHGAVIDAVRAVARERGWPTTWLNEQATAYMPTVPDRHSQVVFDHPALQVSVASPGHMLGMKARSARAQDLPDVITLLHRCGISTVDEVEAIVAGVFGGEELNQRQRRWIGEAISCVSGDPSPGGDTPDNDLAI